MRAIELSRVGFLIPSVLLATVGCADFAEAPSSSGPTFYQPSVAPTASILFPAVGDSLTAGETVEVVAMAADADGERADLTAAWFVGDTTICEGITPDEHGRIVCVYTPAEGEGELTLRVEDADGKVTEVTTKISVETGVAPTISMSGPSTQNNYTDYATEFTGQIAGAGMLTLSFTSNQDGAEVFDIEVAKDGSFVASAMLSEGDHVITAFVESDNGTSSIQGTTVYVGGPNTAPDCTILTPADGEAVRTGTFSSMTAEVADADEEPGALRVMWSSSVDGYLGEGQLDPASGLASMDTVLSAGTHEIKVLVYDEVGAGCEDTVKHVVGAPADLVVSGPNALIDQGDEAEFEASFEGANGERVTWSVDGRSLGTSRLNEAGISTFTTAALPSGTSTVTAQLLDVAGWTISGEVEVVVNGRPSKPVLSGGGSVASNIPLTTSFLRRSIDPEGAEVSYQYSWSINGVAAPAYSRAFLPAFETAVGDEVTVRVVGNDGRIDSTPVEVAFEVVNSAPTVDSVTIYPSTPSSADTVLCMASASDADDHAVTMFYSWMADGAVVATGEVLPAGMVRGGQHLECRVEASDGLDTAVASTSPLAVLRSAPTIDSLAFDALVATTDTVLGALYNTADLDMDLVQVEYAWTVNGASAGNAMKLDGADWFDVGDTVQLTVTPVDSHHRGNPATVSIVIGDSAPEAPVLDFERAVSREGDDLVCTIDTPAEDPDGDAVTYTFSWARNGRIWDGASVDTYEAGDTIEGAEVVEGDEWTCIVEASAGDAVAVDAVAREIERPLIEAVVEYTMADLEGAEDTCSGAEAVADGSLVDAESGVAYVAVPIIDLPAGSIFEMDVTVEAAACNAAEGASGTFTWAVADPGRTQYPAVGQASLAAPGDCTCPDSGEVLEMTAEVDGSIASDLHEIILGIDADSFSLIEDADGTVITVSYWY
ncbi:MAG: hypothetical protein CL927_15570 [Deltaproteobacteria bacterium]|nr:hypothetical protein [Deltaproteobacteria bacterium]HCH65597.1 hypothetical protein [Deltaproteobacteria bacterium]